MNARKLPSGNYNVQIYDYTDHNGKQHYKSFTAKTKAKAERLAEGWNLQKKHITEIERFDFPEFDVFDDFENVAKELKDLAKNDFADLNGIEFENVCLKILRCCGFYGRLTPKNGDHGADILARFSNSSFSIQCKYSKNSIGFDAIKEVYTSKGVYNTEHAIVMTNSFFTYQAIIDALPLDVTLWDGDRLKHIINNLKRRKKYECSQIAVR